jgi:hypothetical protein
MELNVSGEICSFSQEEEALMGLSDWQLQQTAKTKKIAMRVCCVIEAIFIQNNLLYLLKEI